jgi:hypothetical protein
VRRTRKTGKEVTRGIVNGNRTIETQTLANIETQTQNAKIEQTLGSTAAACEGER